MRVIGLDKKVFDAPFCMAMSAQKIFADQIENLSFGGLARALSMGEAGLTVVLANVKKSGKGIKLNVSDAVYIAWVVQAEKNSADFKRAAEQGNFARLARVSRRCNKQFLVFKSWLDPKDVPTGEIGKP